MLYKYEVRKYSHYVIFTFGIIYMFDKMGELSDLVFIPQ